MRNYLLLICLLALIDAKAQELYVFTEPASNMPSHSVSIKLNDRFVTNDNLDRGFSHRFMPELMIGFTKNLMVHLGFTLSNMHTPALQYESLNFYAKYRFYSQDEIHEHFRMAAFVRGSASQAPFHYDEVNIMGDKSGLEGGLIATMLKNKFALSATVSHTQVLHKSRNDKVIYVPERFYQSMNYSLSGGLLVFPREYTDYKQTNLNLYTEILAQQLFDTRRYYIDIAPAFQLIFNSNAKLNVGYRFQLGSNMSRMANNSWLISFERTFLNALKK